MFKTTNQNFINLWLFGLLLFGLLSLTMFFGTSKVTAAKEATQTVSCSSETELPQKRNDGSFAVLIFCPNGEDIKTVGFDSQTSDVSWECPAGTNALQVTIDLPPKALRLSCSDNRTRPTVSIVNPTPLPAPGGGGTGGGGGNCTELAIDVGAAACGKNRLMKYITALVRFLSLGVGIIVVIMIIVGGIQYTSSGGDPGAVAAAKSRVFNAIIALLLYIFTIAILNWLVPGGII